MNTGFAPAKINLFLHVGPLGRDGYHPLHSWMVFADVGDQVNLIEGGAGLKVTGPFSAGVPADGSNLVIKARDAFLAEHPLPPFGLVLDKQLPPASGIGGGSSDAAAVLRLLQARASIPPERLSALALSLGADVPACLQARRLNAEGRGEQLSPTPDFPPLPAVLVNPGVAVSTGDVFRKFDDGAPARLETWRPAGDLTSVASLIRALAAGTRNDLQPPALQIAPAVGEVIDIMAADQRAGLARMSGSGATCFALCESREDAESLAVDLAARYPKWWVRATTLS